MRYTSVCLINFPGGNIKVKQILSGMDYCRTMTWMAQSMKDK